MKNPHQIGLSLAVAALLTACGGGSNSTSVSTSNNGNTTTPSTTASKPALKQVATHAELESLIKQQMLELYGTVHTNVCRSDVCIMPVAATTTTAPAAADTARNFSTTTTQESSVDEADRVKTDGTYLYTLSTTNGYAYPMPAVPLATADASSAPYPATAAPGLRIFKTDQASATVVKEMALDSDSSITPNGLYLNDKQLVALAEKGQMFGIWSRWFIPAYWMDQQSQVYMLNVTNPANPTQTAKLTLDGQVISSRKIGSVLYLATRHSPSLPGLNQYPSTEAEAAANRDLINKASLTDFLPDYQLNGGSENEIFSGGDCFMTQYSSKKSYQTSLISLLAIDLNSPTPTPQGKCFVGDTETLYASTEAIYLATTQYDYQTTDNGDSITAVYNPSITTDLHKFSLAGGINYRGSGRVDGHLGWQQDLKPFRMSEHEGVLRLLTYIGDNNPSINPTPARLYTLQENTATQSLEVLAKLPNNTRPQSLGKAGEQIYATRFLGDKGYLVTFRTTDPLYVLDLSNPADPFVASELKIDGYSDYLHPVGDNYLLGIGKDAVPVEGGDEGRGAWYQGVKLSMIDVTDPSHPYEKQKIIIGKRGTETAVSQTHHALTTLQKGNNLQVALPVSLHEGTASYSSGSAASTFYNWTQDELYRLNINTQTGTMQALAPMVSETASASDPDSYSSYQWPNDRAVMIGDFIHYLHGDKVISQAW